LTVSVQYLVMNRWRRYGKDRLYVETSDGVKVGWWDLTTDEAHPESPERRDALVAAVEGWKTSRTAAMDPAPATATAQPEVKEPERVAVAAAPEPVVRPWVDLATNRPGAEAREQAVAAREAAPVKTVFARVLGVHTDERAWRIGADGEEKVAAQLDKVARKDPRWRFLHAVPVGNRGSDLDHLIIGPGGVFTVNAKHHPKGKIWVGGDTVMVNGTKVPYVRNARHEADRAAKLLTAVVTVGAEDVTIKSQPNGVHVTWRRNLAKWLLRHGDIHTNHALEAIYGAARRSTTWR
jgi:hypothetical protein